MKLSKTYKRKRDYHIHILFGYSPNLALSEIVRRFKGASSRFAKKAKFPEVMRKLWRKAFWSPSYFIVSCGGAPLNVVKTYVDTQQTRPPTHHRKGNGRQSRPERHKVPLP